MYVRYHKHFDFKEKSFLSDKLPPPKNRRRYYPSEKDIANYMYKSRLLSRLSQTELEQIEEVVKKFQEDKPQEKAALKIETTSLDESPLKVRGLIISPF